MFDSDKFAMLCSGEGEPWAPASFPQSLKAIDESDDPLRPDGEQAEQTLAILEALFLMIAAEGQVMEEEEDAARSVLCQVATPSLGAGTIEELLAGFAERLENEGFAARLESVGRALRSDHGLSEQTFRLCAAVVVADGKPADEENETLNELIDQLALDDQRADEILEEVATRLSTAA